MNELWQRLQDLEWSMYKESPIGVFSVDGLKGAEVTGRIINETIPGKDCLDVGSGALDLPYYMKVADKVNFVGIDPYEGDVRRDYYFERGEAEDLPFKDKSFDGVLFATSLDHVKSPVMAINEAGRVLKDDGYLFVWISLRKPDLKYRRWKKGRKPAQYDEYHMWAFSAEDLYLLIGEYMLVDEVKVRGREVVITAKKKP